MMLNHLKKNKRTVVVTCIMTTTIATIITMILFSTYYKQNKTMANHVMSSYNSKIQYAIDSRILSADTLKKLIEYEGGMIHNFEEIAQELIGSDSAVQSLQVAPDGVVEYIYPKKSNEEGYVDLFAIPERKTEANYAKDTGKTTIAGPFELFQGGTGVVVRIPIFLPEDDFWGFSIIILNTPEIFDMAELDQLEGQGYSYSIWKNNPQTNEVQVINSNTESFNYDKSISKDIIMTNEIWTFSIIPESEHWIPLDRVILESFFFLMMTILIIAIVSANLVLSDQKKELIVLADTDYLTHLYNARKMDELLAKLKEDNKPFGFGYFDLNEFKIVNDKYGHDIGDYLLKEVSFRLQKSVTRTDMLFRIGGDEFAIIVPTKNTEKFYYDLEAKIQKEVTQPYKIQDIILYPKISCGFSRYPEDSTNLNDVIKFADEKMYMEKERYKKDLKKT